MGPVRGLGLRIVFFVVERRSKRIGLNFERLRLTVGLTARQKDFSGLSSNDFHINHSGFLLANSWQVGWMFGRELSPADLIKLQRRRLITCHQRSLGAVSSHVCRVESAGTHLIFITSSTAQGGGGSFKNRKPIGEVGCCESQMAERSQ